MDFSELISFLVKNQFKKKLHKYIVKTGRDTSLSPPEDMLEKISKILDPNEGLPSEDKVRILMYVATGSSPD